jgi:hypothetical protein
MVASNRVTARLWLISHIGLSRIFKASFLAAATLLLSSQLALAQFTQQGPKLVGTGAIGQALQGTSVALSADGDTAIVGGWNDNGGYGAAWVFVQPSLQVTPATNMVAAGKGQKPATTAMSGCRVVNKLAACAAVHRVQGNSSLQAELFGAIR